MSHDFDSSLSEYIRSRALAPDLQAILVALAERTEQPQHDAEYQEMLTRAQPAEAPLMPVPALPSSHPKHKRDRHGLHMIPGGLAALLPVALLSHGFPAGMAALARWLWGSARGRAVASVLAVSTGAAVGIPVAAEQAMARPVVHPPAAVREHHRRHAERPAAAPAAPSPTATAHRYRRRHHSHRGRAHHAAMLPTPPASPLPPPSPGPSPTGSPTPTPSVTPTPGVSPLGQVARRLVPGDLPWLPMLP